MEEQEDPEVPLEEEESEVPLEQDELEVPQELDAQLDQIVEKQLHKESRGTITAKPDFDEKWAAERLKKSLKGIGSDEKMIVKILVSHDSLQRQAVEEKYKAMYGQDLIEELKAELGGHFEMAVIALLTSNYDLLVQALNDSFTFIGSDSQTLIEILCSRDAESINSLCWQYENNFGQSLDDAIESNLSGQFKNLINSLVTAQRPSDEEVIDEEEAKEDAQRLYDAGIGLNSSTDEGEFISLFNNSSYSHLKRVFEIYSGLSDEPIEDSINSEFNGDLRDGLLAIVKRVKDPPGFFAERLNMSLRGSGTDDKTLIRIIVSRAEEDLRDIKARYQEMYGSSLANDVKEDTSGDYCKLLLAIINNKD